MRGPGTRMPPSHLSYAPCGPQGTQISTQDTEDTVGAAHRSAARAWGARPVPFRTRKLSPIAPRVLGVSPWEARAPLTGGRHRAVRLN